MPKKEPTNIMPLILLGGAGVGGYFLWKYLKEEPEKKGFVEVESGFDPSTAPVGGTIVGIIIGKNNTEESNLCFIKLVDQETGELLTPLQSVQVGAGLSQQFTFEFIMPDKPILRFNVHFGRIIDGKETIDDTRVYRIKRAEPGYPKEICRNPYCFIVYTQEQETQMKEFLGLEPEGAADLDTYLRNLTQEQLVVWRDYWVDVWTTLKRQDIVIFVIGKYNEYLTGASASIEEFTITSI